MGTTTETARSLLERWLDSRLGSEPSAWLAEQRLQLDEDRQFYLAFALTPRKVGKEDLSLSPGELAEAGACCAGWDPSAWTLDQAARIALLLASSEAMFPRRLEKLCAIGDIGEQISLYQSLPLYPKPDLLTDRAAEGLRSNIVPVFEAVAHHNPFPCHYFDDAAWNQMVLKALFIGSQLHPIQGLDDRTNEALATTLIDYAHERWAAKRSVNPELWRCVGPHLKSSWVDDLRRAWDTREPMSREAAALAAHSANVPEAAALLNADPVLAERVRSGELDWAFIHRNLTS